MCGGMCCSMLGTPSESQLACQLMPPYPSARISLPFPRAGLWLAPQMVGEAIKGGRLAAAVMAREGYAVTPAPGPCSPWSFITGAWGGGRRWVGAGRVRGVVRGIVPPNAPTTSHAALYTPHVRAPSSPLPSSRSPSHPPLPALMQPWAWAAWSAWSRSAARCSRAAPSVRTSSPSQVSGAESAHECMLRRCRTAGCAPAAM